MKIFKIMNQDDLKRAVAKLWECRGHVVIFLMPQYLEITEEIDTHGRIEDVDVRIIGPCIVKCPSFTFHGWDGVPDKTYPRAVYPLSLQVRSVYTQDLTLMDFNANGSVITTGGAGPITNVRGNYVNIGNRNFPIRQSPVRDGYDAAICGVSYPGGSGTNHYIDCAWHNCTYGGLESLQHCCYTPGNAIIDRCKFIICGQPFACFFRSSQVTNCTIDMLVPQFDRDGKTKIYPRLFIVNTLEPIFINNVTINTTFGYFLWSGVGLINPDSRIQVNYGPNACMVSDKFAYMGRWYTKEEFKHELGSVLVENVSPNS